LLVRGADLRIRGFVNTCLNRPHVLVAGDSGALGAQIACGADGTQYGLDGVLLGAESPACLTALSVSVTDGVVLVNHAAEAPGAPPCLGVGMLSSFGGWRDFALEADWKLVVEHWADTYFDGTARVIGACSGPSDVVVGKAGVSCVWPIDEAGTSGVTRLLYARLAYASGVVGCRVERRLIWPNMFVEQRPDGATVRQVLPVAAGRSRLRLRQYRGASADRAMRAMGYLAARIGRAWEREDARLIESTQAGLEWQEDFGEKGGVALRAFFGWLRGAVPGCYQ
jgi:phenylpropionate dioxygenase-like ring-hydroxylating dioxygenase large terminal subunit